jgi:hypothetical protein
MKSNAQLFILGFIALIFISTSCENKPTSEKKEGTPPSTGKSEVQTPSITAPDTPCAKVVVLNPRTADTYRVNVESRYGRRPQRRRFTEWIFIPVSYLKFIDSFFKKNTDYKEGIRITFIDYGRYIDKVNQASPDQIMISIAPVRSSETQFDAFQTFENEYHILASERETKVFTSYNYSTGEQPNSAITPEFCITPVKDSVLRWKANYKKIFSDSLKYSRSLTLNYETVTALRKLAYNFDVDGFRFTFISYGKILDCVKNLGLHQISLTITPTSGFEPADLFSKSNFAGSELEKFFTTDYLNHGELCPSSCDAIDKMP